MEPWRELAIQMFPERKGLYLDEDETVSQVLFDFHDEIVARHEANDIERLEKIYAYAAWCHSQKEIDAEMWKAAYAAFYEHLGDYTATYKAIPHWVKPEIFQDILGELEDRLDNKDRYPGDTPGSFAELLAAYDVVNSTHFAAERRRTT